MRRLIPRRFYPGRDRVGTEITDLRTQNFAPTFDGVDWYGLPSIVGAIRFLRTNRPNQMIFQWWTGAVLPWYLVLAVVGRWYGAGVILELHEAQDTGELAIPLVGRIVTRGLRRLIGLADAYIVHSDVDARDLSLRLGLEPDRVHVIGHGPYPLAGRREASLDLREPPIGAPEGGEPDGAEPSVILFFGTIRPYKGLEYLVRAFDELCDQEPGRWRLVVVGETWEHWTEPTELIHASRHRHDITLVNRYVIDSDLAGYFDRATVVALPYLRSSASGPLHMAMSHGLPVVVTSVGGLTSVANEYAGAVLAEPASISSLMSGLRAAVALRPPFDDPFSWDITADSILELVTYPKEHSVPSVSETFRSQGYVIMKNLLSSEEVKELRVEVTRELASRGTYKGGGIVLPNAAMNGELVPRLVAQPAILATVREILGAERPLFTLEADLHSNFMASSWHKDTGETVLDGGYFECDPIGRDDCLVIKVAIYLQDHTRSGGLNIRPGSHLTPSLAEGTETSLKTSAGDVVIFDSRLTHRGTLPSFTDRAISRSIDTLPIKNQKRAIARIRSLQRRLIGQPDRLAIYYAYGVPGDKTMTFAQRNMGRQLSQYGDGSSTLDHDVEVSIREAGVDIASLAH